MLFISFVKAFKLEYSFLICVKRESDVNRWTYNLQMVFEHTFKRPVNLKRY